MKRTVLFWIIAVVITLAGVYYQRTTGPTYPLSGKINFSNEEINYRFERSHSTSSDCPVEIKFNNNMIGGKLLWKRFKTNDEFTEVNMIYKEGKLQALLPKQPSAGKLEYFIQLSEGEDEIQIPKDEHIVIRFKDDVPMFILIPHIIAMFGTMLLSTRTGLEFFNPQPKLKRLTFVTLFFLIIGGMILGPITQYYAFGAFWTGFPFGTDLTDNKTLIALIGWVIAFIALYKSQKPERWTFAASILLLVVYLIPHSMFGSELDYNKLDQKKTETENINQLN
ncbi:MAG: hypothetical protein IPM56_15705 [Ignavibacteriales bacterium]|nr:MAG: hypothetical protein IPM56_15705 [Ignavibacteriales bacterium]